MNVVESWKKEGRKKEIEVRQKLVVEPRGRGRGQQRGALRKRVVALAGCGAVGKNVLEKGVKRKSEGGSRGKRTNAQLICGARFLSLDHGGAVHSKNEIAP